MKAEWFARVCVILLGIGLPLIAIVAGSDTGVIEVHGKVAESGGWTPGNLSAVVGQSIHLRLTSDDVVHSFAIGQSDQAPIDVMPGQRVDTTLVFDKPGKYTFYCTRWCGVNHWRMRGTIEVSGSSTAVITPTTPLYVALKLSLDDPHTAEIVPASKPSAAQADSLGVQADLPAGVYRTQSPVEVWKQLRAASFSNGLSDTQVWNLVAWVWRSSTTPESIASGKRLYAQNCAACHGEAGRGDGVMAAPLKKAVPSDNMSGMPGHDPGAPANFTDARNMLGASSAILQGKIIRGGMGTGMPYWGPIFTDAQIWSLVDYLWTFQFEEGDKP